MGAATDVQLLANAVRNPGRLVLGPTTVSGSFPFGGKAIGMFVQGMRARFDVKYDRRYDPASKALVEIGRSVENLALLGLMLGWDEDLVAAFLTNTTPTASLPVTTTFDTGMDGASVPKLVPAQLPILFVADDPNHKCVYLRRPVVTIDMSDPVTQLGLSRKAGLLIEIEPTLPAGGKKQFQIRQRQNLDLS